MKLPRGVIVPSDHWCSGEVRAQECSERAGVQGAPVA